MAQEINKHVAKEWHELFGTQYLKDNYDNYLHYDFTADYFGQTLNREQYILQDIQFAAAFKDNKVVVTDQIVEGDKVVSILTWTAIHVADLQGIPASGRPINIKGIAVDYFKDGKIFRHFRIFDTAQILRRQVIRGQVREAIARDLHDNIGSTLGSIAYYSELARQLPEEKQSQREILLQKIENTSQELVEEMGDIVWAIDPLNDSFEKLTLRMKNYAFELLGSSNIDFHFEVKDLPDLLRLKVEVRKNIFLIFKESIYNALKYSDCSSFRVSFDTRDHMLMIEFADDGKGFNVNETAAYNGNGLKNMAKRTREIGAEFFIHSRIGKGTQIQMKIPIKSSE